MDWQTIVAIAGGVFGVVSCVAWSALIKKIKNMWANLCLVKTAYQEALEDDNITDEERLEIADRLIAVIVDATDIWQTITNMIVSILGVIANKRPTAKASLYKIMKW